MTVLRDSDSLTVWLQGGLGNQLFQFNACLAKSADLGVQPRIAKVSFVGDRKRRFELGVSARGVSVEPMWASYAKGSPYTNGKLNDFTPRGKQRIATDLKTAAPGDLLVGFFQDRDSVSIGTDRMTQRLNDVPLGRNAAAIAATVRSSVAAHVRRGDYVTLDSARRTFGEIKPSYYFTALEELGTSVEEVVFFTDDSDYVQRTFGVPRSQIVSDTDIRGPLETICVMGAAAHIIIPNSTFSWWASEMVARHGRVIAPEVWFLDRSADLAPHREHWTRIDAH